MLSALLNRHDSMGELLVNILSFVWRPILEMMTLAIFFYYLFGFIRGTRAVQVLKGLVILLVVFFLAQRLDLATVNWLMGKVFPVLVLALIILFQPELRKVLASLGGNPFLPSLMHNEAVFDGIVEACHILSKKRIGALIAIEDTVGLKNYIESGVRIDAQVSTELLMTLFHPKTPLHDGGVIIQGEHIAAAACLFPLSQESNFGKSMGTRHRAAIGLSEETDALVIVVSEETGRISVATEGKFIEGLEQEGLKMILKKRFVTPAHRRTWFYKRKEPHATS